MKKIVLVFSAGILGMCIVLGSFVPAFAQDDGGGSDTFTLEEVTVTAAKRGEQDLQKVPIAMDVITGENFAETAKANVDDILESLAGVFINTMADGMRISIRGITDTDPVYGGRKSSSPTVAMNVDGAYNNMNSSGQNLFDVERIEVLMGPQSTLYAANSPGGVVNIITASPKTDRFSGNASVEYGSYERSVLQGALNVPIVQDKVAARLSVNRTRENSFMKPYTDELSTKNDAARLKVLWEATDGLEITLTGNYAKNGNQGEMGQQAAPFDKASGSKDWTVSPTAQGTNSPLDQITKGGNVNISWDSPVGNLEVTPSYSESDASGTVSGYKNYPPGPPGDPNATQIYATWYSSRVMEQKGAEARLASPDDLESLQYVLGLTYYKSQFDTYETFNDTDEYPNLSSQLSHSNVNNSEQKAFYGNITYPLPFNDKLSVTAGYRYSQDYAHQIDIDPGRANPGNPLGIDETEMDVSNPDYKLGFQYDMTDQTMFYGSYTSSFRTDSMSMANNDGYRPPEELKAYTVGAKTRMLNNRLQLNTSAYYYDYKDHLAQNTMARGSATEEELKAHTFPDGTTTISQGEVVDIGGLRYWDWIDQSHPNPDGTYNYMDGGWMNWGKQRTLGVDVNVSWVASPKDMVEFTLSYLDMTWTELRFNYIFDDEGFFPDQNYDGRTSPNAPKFSMTASYEHKFDIGSYGVLTPHIDVLHKTGFDLTFDVNDGTGYGIQEAYYLYNASLSFVSASQKWSVSAIAKNIGNYAVKRSYEAEPGRQALRLGDPRTYVFTVTARF